MEQNNPSHDYVLSLYEVCEILSKSSRTVSRYVHRNILHPVGVKSRQGTLEYRFSRAEVDELKRRELARLSFPRLGDVMPGMASFASMDYQAAPTMPRTRFTIPGIAYPPPSTGNRPEQSSDSQALPTSPAKTDAGIAAGNSNSFSDLPPETVVGHANPADNELASDRDNRPVIKLLKETTEMLRDQLRVKDNQIKDLDEKIGQLIERNRETNILLKGLQDKMVLLEQPKNENKEDRSQQSAKGGDAVPAAAPGPVPAPGPMPGVKVRVAYSDTVPMADTGSNPGNDGEWEEAPDRPRGGFFGKMFHQ